MPHELEYIVDKAVMMCDEGAKPNFFRGTNNPTVKINGCKVCITTDKKPLVNLPEFGVCAKTGSPCIPVPTAWQDTYKVKVKGQQTLLYKSKMPCGKGGKIEFVTSGQIPVSQAELEAMTGEYGESPEEEESGLSWLDAVELVPFIGGVVGMVRSAAKDPTDWLGFGLSAVSLVLDVAGLFSFGAGNAAAGAVRASKVGRAAVKVAKATSKVGGKAGKLATKAGGKILGKAGGKALAKSLANKVDDIALKTGKVCVFACFPAGTKIAVAEGHKNIEDIKAGDLVWAWDEETGKSELKAVVHTMQKEVDATIELTLGEEVIETTAEHPFYTTTGWKDAADITEEDSVKTKGGDWQRVEASNFLYNKKKVYNFEVADWHTYYVGALMWLVHNACYRKIFFKAYPHLKGKVVVHHAVEQQVLKKWQVYFKKNLYIH